MKPFLRRRSVAILAAAAVVLVAMGVALAPWWIDLAPVRAKIERAASAALGGRVTLRRIDLTLFPRAQIVLGSVEVSVPGTVRATARSVNAALDLLPLVRGRVSISRFGVDGLEVTLDLPETKKDRSAPPPHPDPLRGLRAVTAGAGLNVGLRDARVILSRQGHGTLALEGVRLEAAVRFTQSTSEIVLARLSVESPRLAAEGSFRIDSAAPRAEAAARGTDLDATGVREKLLAFAGDDRLVAEICGAFRGGTLTSFSFASSGTVAADLGALERMSIRATVDKGTVRIPGPDLVLEDVRADVSLEGGILSAERAEARVGKSRASEGRLRLGLGGGRDVLRVEARIRAHLAEVPSLLRRVIRSRSFRDELALVEDVSGKAEGVLTIGDRASDLRTVVSLSKLRFSAGYRRIPWPVEVSAGGFLYDGTRVGVSRLSGRVGRSTFSDLTARVRLARAPVLEAASGSIVAALDDLYAGLAPREGMEAIPRNVRRVSGSASVTIRRLAGPVSQPRAWIFECGGTLSDVVLDTPSLPGPLEVASGRFGFDTGTFRVTDADARVLDATLRVSGLVRGLREGAPAIEAAADGVLGPRAVAWGWTRAALPGHYRVATPIALSGVRLSLAGGAFSLGGEFVLADGPRVSLDLSAGGGTTDVRDLTIADGDQRASIVLHRQAGKIDLGFKGRLDVSTVSKLLAEGRPRAGGLEGDIRASVPDGNLGRLTAEGALRAADLEIPTPAGTVTVERLEARAAGSRIDVTSSSLVLDGQRLTAAGRATFRDGISLDLDVSTGALSWTRVEEILGRLADAEKKKKKPGAALPIGGDVRFSLESFTYGRLAWKPVSGAVRFGKDALAVTIDKAGICGISTTGEARFLTGGVVALTARADASGPDINVPLTCLGVREGVVTGSYEARVQLEGESEASQLARVVRGPVTLTASKGRIGKAGLFTRILTALNGTEVFAGKDKTRVGDAMPYDRLAVTGNVAEGRFSIGESTFVAPSMTMVATGTVGIVDRSLDVMVLSHPLSTLDSVVQAVPVVRHVLGRDFLAVPVKVTGSFDDPKATVTPAKDIGKGLVGILERTLTLPVTVFDPPPAARK